MPIGIQGEHVNLSLVLVAPTSTAGVPLVIKDTNNQARPLQTNERLLIDSLTAVIPDGVTADLVDGIPGGKFLALVSPSSRAVTAVFVSPATGNIVVAGDLGSNLYTYDPGLNLISTFSTGFINPQSYYSIDAAGDIYFPSNDSSHTVVKFDSSGAILQTFVYASAIQIIGAAVDPISGDLWAVDESANLAYRWLADGTFQGSTNFGGNLSGTPTSIRFDPVDNTLWINTFTAGIIHGNTNGVFLNSFGASGPNNTNFAIDLAVTKDTVIVANYHIFAVQIFTKFGGFVGQFGSQGNGPGQFNGPQGVAVDANNNIFVAGDINDNFQKFTPFGLGSNLLSVSSSANRFYQVQEGLSLAPGIIPQIGLSATSTGSVKLSGVGRIVSVSQTNPSQQSWQAGQRANLSVA